VFELNTDVSSEVKFTLYSIHLLLYLRKDFVPWGSVSQTADFGTLCPLFKGMVCRKSKDFAY
jgi:hypothetical protein